MNRREFTLLSLAGPLAACALEPHSALVSNIQLRIDVASAEALLDALERTSITDAEIDRLLRMRGVAAMVDNTTKYLPDDTRDVFRAAMKNMIATGNPVVGHFGLSGARVGAARTRGLIAELQRASLVDEVAAPVNRYRPASGHLSVTAYCVVGGASDGFVVDGDSEPAFFMAIDRAEGDLAGVKLNMAHELYHVAQRAARAHVRGLDSRIFHEATATAPARLLNVVLEEGTATYISEPVSRGAWGPYIDMWRSNYAKNAPPERIEANFALFDEIAAALSNGAMDWRAAYEKGFAGMGPPLYFVGYEMAKAIDHAHGPARIGRYFHQHPAEFFGDYVALYRGGHPVPARFSAATQRLIDSMR